MHCYPTPADIQDARNLAELGFVIGDEYFAIHDFEEE